MHLPQFPQRIEDVDHSWLTSALRAGGFDVDVSGVRVVDVINGACTKLRLALEYDRPLAQSQALPSTMILKGAFEAHSASISEVHRMEARFYEQLAPGTPLNMPRIFYAGLDQETFQAIILMEDLVARGVTFCRPQIPLEFKQVESGLVMLAKMHARTWQSPELGEGGRLHWLQSRFVGFSQGYNNSRMEPEIWRRYIESPRGAALSRRFHDADWMRHALRRLGEIEAHDPLCAIHGDTHPGNLFIDADGTAGFYDPLPARACWWLEATYHIVSSLDLANRRDWEQALLKTYLDALSNSGIAAPDFDLAWLRYRQAIAYGMFIFLVDDTAFQSEATCTACTARFGVAALDHDTMGALA